MPGGEQLLSIAVGLGLAAASGFRVFLPLLAAGAASRLGYLPLAGGFDWLATTPALVALGVATVLEVLAYYIPWLDNALDTIATPAAIAAGVLASMAVLTDVPPGLRWAIGIIGGGSAAGLIQGITALLRLKSSALTGGLANPVFAAAETTASLAVAVLAVVVPVLALFALLLAGAAVWTRRAAA